MPGNDKVNAWRRNNLKMANVYLNKYNPEDAEILQIFASVDSKTQLVKESVRYFLKTHPKYIASHPKKKRLAGEE